VPSTSVVLKFCNDFTNPVSPIDIDIDIDIDIGAAAEREKEGGREEARVGSGRVGSDRGGRDGTGRVAAGICTAQTAFRTADPIQNA
jgi:hypothetical protein